MNIKKIMAGIMAAAMLITASGCTGRSNDKARVDMESSFESYMSKVLNSKDASKFVDAKKEAEYSVTPEQEEILKCVLKNADYEIEDSEASAKDKEGSITIKFKYADVKDVTDSYYDIQMEAVLNDIANYSKKYFLRKEITVDMVKAGDSWLVTKKSDSNLKKELQAIVEDIYLEPYATTVTEPLKMNKVGISFPTNDLMRWRDDGSRLVEGLEAFGYEVDLRYAGNDVNQQIVGIMGQIDAGCSVIIIAAIDSPSLRDVLDMAEEKGVTVIAYDRLIYETDTLDYYVTFDNFLLGVMQGQYIAEKLKLSSAPAGKVYNIEITAGDPSDPAAKLFYDGAMDVLMPYITQGVLKVPSGQIEFSNAATDAWSTDRAQIRAENIISAYYLEGNVIDAWLCSNDSTALGVTKALELNYTGSYPVITGQDCDIANVKNIISGKQAMSIFKDTRNLVDATVTMTYQILTDGSAVVNNRDRYNNGVMNVPSCLISPVIVDANNYKDILIQSGYYTEDDLT